MDGSADPLTGARRDNAGFGVYAKAVHPDGYRENKQRTPMTIVSNNPYVFSG